MEVRVKFSADVVLKGNSLDEIKEKWESFPLFSADALEEGGAEYCEILSVEELPSYNDIIHEWNELG